ncbi:peptidoglycan recognition protein family protein [Streptantibioticus silvisoli]|uniref:N-acetylmuramoyl-L-alanine amidase n=1 Tax=Streptantibioticus silvisoli TaxID=2705255 RepID=A0ABT6W3C4_9ACTN|nr:N-acetylmuramoyl-L-alanine amidase [Streptantibioticus silvisoli]MDI5965210.1 N-acetylmuramoyl-L-alanine amidase [Streptantibioticus silvisoli]
MSDAQGAARFIPLTPLPAGDAPRARGAVAPEGLTSRVVKPFSMLGVTWDDGGTALRGAVQVRTRSLATGGWSGWRDLEAGDDRPDTGSAEAAGGAVRGGTAPLWVGDADGVQVRVTPDGAVDRVAGTRAPALPHGLRVDLVDPGTAPAGTAADPGPASDATRRSADGSAPARAAGDSAGDSADASRDDPLSGSGDDPVSASAGDSASDPAGDAMSGPADDSAGDPAPDSPGASGDSAGGSGDSPTGSGDDRRAGHAARYDDPDGSDGWDGGDQGDLPDDDDPYTDPAPHTAPRPAIVSRAGWKADESLRETAFAYTGTTKAVFVHHTATSNDYACADAPAIVRGIYRYHVRAEGWRDIGYNFLIDKCGRIYEGRAGGVTRAVLGAHTLGFNTDTTGVAVIGTFTKAKPSAAAVRALERLAAWKLGLTGVNAAGRTTLTSAGSNKYAPGVRVSLNTISGHRDGFTTACPGTKLYAQLPAVRRAAAALQGR